MFWIFHEQIQQVGIFSVCCPWFHDFLNKIVFFSSSKPRRDWWRCWRRYSTHTWSKKIEIRNDRFEIQMALRKNSLPHWKSSLQYVKSTISFWSRFFKKNSFSGSYHQNMIRSAMDEIQYYTCIRFVERSQNDYDYVYIANGEFWCRIRILWRIKIIFISGTGCSSYIGRAGGSQRLNLLNSNCKSPNV